MGFFHSISKGFNNVVKSTVKTATNPLGAVQDLGKDLVNPRSDLWEGAVTVGGSVLGGPLGAYVAHTAYESIKGQKNPLDVVVDDIRGTVKEVGQFVNEIDGTAESDRLRKGLAKDAAAANTLRVSQDAVRLQENKARESLNYMIQGRVALGNNQSALANNGVAMAGSSLERQTLGEGNLIADTTRMNDDAKYIADAMNLQAKNDEAYSDKMSELHTTELNYTAGNNLSSSVIRLGFSAAMIA